MKRNLIGVFFLFFIFFFGFIMNKQMLYAEESFMVLENGRIIERGDHDDLIEQHGKYYQLYTGAFELE